MNYYRLINNYRKSLKDLSSEIEYKIPSIVDFGTAMINKRRTKRKGGNKYGTRRKTHI